MHGGAGGGFGGVREGQEGGGGGGGGGEGCHLPCRLSLRLCCRLFCRPACCGHLRLRPGELEPRGLSLRFARRLMRRSLERRHPCGKSRRRFSLPCPRRLTRGDARNLGLVGGSRGG